MYRPKSPSYRESCKEQCNEIVKQQSGQNRLDLNLTDREKLLLWSSVFSIITHHWVKNECPKCSEVTSTHCVTSADFCALKLQTAEMYHLV